ncbi:MAG: efflux transporter periplasmic adaptor subunit [Rhodospirillaceae bacterium]|nr:efflux transporter periplasmic adaptor subunit [Rhodospirillaceae bacterium]
MHRSSARSRGRPLLAVLVTVGLSLPIAAVLAQEGRPAVQVEAQAIEPVPLVEAVSAIGTLNSNEAVVVRPEIDGRIVEIAFEEGEPVAKGDVLVKLDSEIYRTQLAEAQARAELSARNYERAKALFDKGHGSAQTLDEAQAQRRADQAAVAVANAWLGKTTIAAPFDGIVGLRHVSVGDYVRAGEDIVNLENINPLKVDFSLPERYLRVVSEGRTVDLELDAFPGEHYSGTVYAINPKIDPGGRSVAVRATLDNSEGRLRPGLFARVKLIVDQRQTALVVPEEAIVPRGDERFVFVVRDGTAHMTKVELGLRQTGRVEVVDGLTAGDIVVTAGHAKIRDGSAVDIRAPATEEKAPVSSVGNAERAS